MKFIRLIYFHIYNSYYADGNYQSDIPHLTAFGIVGCSFSVILLVITFATCQFFFAFEPSVVLVTVLFICLLMVFYFVLLHKRRYAAIYLEFKNSKYDATLMRVISWLVLIIAFVMAVTYAYYFDLGTV